MTVFKGRRWFWGGNFRTEAQLDAGPNHDPFTLIGILFLLRTPLFLTRKRHNLVFVSSGERLPFSFCPKNFMRTSSFFLAIMVLASPAWAVEAPSMQARLGPHDVLRGNFTEEHQANESQPPIRTAGHFVATPAQGLIWGIEKPLPTSTIITEKGVAQDFNGLTVQLPARKNLGRLYDMVSAALSGNWQKLEADFSIRVDDKNGRWNMTLTPRPGTKPQKTYSAITVSGSRYVENIVMAKLSGGVDSFSFENTSLSATPLTPQETALFSKIKPQ